MGTFLNEVTRYKAINGNDSMTVDQISTTLQWPRNTSYVFKYYISQLSDPELNLIDSVEGDPDYEVIKAVSLVPRQSREYVLSNYRRIVTALSPFIEIDLCIEESTGGDILETFRSEYWLCVSQYLQQRDVDVFPFSKKAIHFIGGISSKSYNLLSNRQKEWIRDLLKSDRERPQTDQFFVNEHVLQCGFQQECSMVKTMF